MPPLTDVQLIASMAANDPAALRLLYDRHVGRVYGIALSYLRVEADAEEVTQDVFAKAWRAAANFRAESQVTTWLYRIAVNTSLTAVQKRQRRGRFSLFGPTDEPSDDRHPEAETVQRETDEVLRAGIYGLPNRQKTAFVLSYVEDLPRQQVADVMQLSLKAVESLLMRAKKNLREGLRAEYPNRF